MEKTILQWLNEIEEPEIREAAISQCQQLKIKSRYSKLSDVISGAFIWDLTQEGHKYWEKYRNKLIQQGK